VGHQARGHNAAVPRLVQRLSRALSAANFRRLQRRLALRRLAEYQRWVQAHDALTPDATAALHERAATLVQVPALGFVLQPVDAEATALPWRRTLAALQAQWHGPWELLVLLPPLLPAALRDELHAVCGAEPRARCLVTDEAPSACLARLQAPWVGLLRAGDVLPPHALLLLAEALCAHPQAMAVYADEDVLDSQGRRCLPNFKPDWNPELLLSCGYTGAPALVRAGHVPHPPPASADAWPVGDAAIVEHDLALRCTAGLAPAQVVHVPHVLCHRADVPQLAGAGQVEAVRRHLARTGVAAAAEADPLGGCVVRHAVPQPAPLVSIVVPTRDGLALLQRCLHSVQVHTADVPHEVIVVDNGSQEADTLAWLQALQQAGQARVLRDDGPFNYSALNNAAVAVAEGEFVLLLNNDTEVLGPGWLSAMLGLALQPGIGAVGARLWFDDMSLQHAGLVLGLDGVAGYAHRRLREGVPGYQGRAHLLQAVGAVTAACLLVRRVLYLQVGGLDDRQLAVAYNDVDLCLKLEAAGHRAVWTPLAQLLHYESRSRGSDQAPERVARFNAEFDVMRRRWGAVLDHDPAYNPNLALSGGAYNLAWPPRVSLAVPWFTATVPPAHGTRT